MLTDDDFKEIALEMQSMFQHDVADSEHEPLKFGFQVQLARRAIDRRKACQAKETSVSEESKTASETPTSGDGSANSTASVQSGLSEQPSGAPITENSAAATCAATPDDLPKESSV